MAAVFASEFSSPWPRGVVEYCLVSCVLFDAVGSLRSAETGV